MTAEQIRLARDPLTRADNTVSSIARLLGVSRHHLQVRPPQLPAWVPSAAALPRADGAAWSAARRRARATTNGHVTWTADTSRSARPRAVPPWVSKTTQASRARNTAVTAPAPRALRISGCDGARRAVKAGHMVIAAAPRKVQARCC